MRRRDITGVTQKMRRRMRTGGEGPCRVRCTNDSNRPGAVPFLRECQVKSEVGIHIAETTTLNFSVSKPVADRDARKSGWTCRMSD